MNARDSKRYAALLGEMSTEMEAAYKCHAAANFGAVAEHMDVIGDMAKKVAKVARKLADG